MNNVILILCFVATFQSSFSQEETYSYDDHPVLTWEDFKGEPNPESPHHASTNSGFSYSWSYSTSNGKRILDYKVFSTFYPNKSWVRPNKKTDRLLKHEQLHYDISELHARKLRQAMANYELGRNIRKDLKNLYADIEAQRQAMQQQFDAETNHSSNKKAETKWQNFIAEELEKLSDYTKG